MKRFDSVFAAGARQIVGKPDSYAFGRSGGYKISRAFDRSGGYRTSYALGRSGDQ
jgi:hypothetical protein